MNRAVLATFLLLSAAASCAMARNKHLKSSSWHSGGGHSSGSGLSGSGWSSEDDSLPPSQLYPYGIANGDGQLPAGDDLVVIVPLATPFRFFGHKYHEVYVNNNGILSFGANVSEVYQAPCAAGTTPLIAALWADVDTTYVEGAVYFRETTDKAQLLRAADDVQQRFSSHARVGGLAEKCGGGAQAAEFIPTSLFIVTWFEVSYWGSCFVPLADSPRNIFQLILASDGSHSYVTLTYKQIMWTGLDEESNDCVTGIGDSAAASAMAGFDQGDGEVFYQLTKSCTPSLPKIVEKSNVGVAGQFMYRVDRSLQEACEAGGGGGAGASHGHNYDKMAAFENVLRGAQSCC